MPTTVHEHLEGALDTALEQARAGEAILFSPAFSSHDQFVNYAARAQRFQAWVERRQRSCVSLPGVPPPNQARSWGGLGAQEG